MGAFEKSETFRVMIKAAPKAKAGLAATASSKSAIGKPRAVLHPFLSNIALQKMTAHDLPRPLRLRAFHFSQ